MGGKGCFELLVGTEKGDDDEPFGLLFFRGADPKGSGADGALDEDGFLLVGALGTGNAGNCGGVVPSFFLNGEAEEENLFLLLDVGLTGNSAV